MIVAIVLGLLALRVHSLTSDGTPVVVQLGDSFSSGNGARDSAGAVNYAGVPECYRSPTTWGALAASALKNGKTNSSAQYINRACSGGFISQIVGIRGLGTRFTSKVDGVCSGTPPYAPEEYYLEDSPSPTSSCQNYLQSQILGVTNQTDIVLLASGGNDFKFGSIILNCLTFNIRTVSGCQAAINFVYANLDMFGTVLTNSLLTIKSRLNDKAKIVVVAYPHIVLNTPETYDPRFEPGQIEITNNLRNLGLAMENSQKTAVAAANQNSTRDFVIFYNQTKPLFEGHEPHPEFFSANPNRWIAEHFPEGGRTVEVYHLNAIGHRELGNAMGSFLTSVINQTAITNQTAPTSPLAPNAPVTNPQAPVANPQAPATVPQAPLAAPQLHVVAPFPSLRTFSPTKPPSAKKCRGIIRCFFKRLFSRVA